MKPTDISILIATVNGSGSQSANMILAKSLFRMGLPVATKNVFPSNIAGLPTWFSIRVNSNGFLGRRLHNDIVIAKNPQTVADDLRSVAPTGIFIFDREMKLSIEASQALDEWNLKRRNQNLVPAWPVSFREIVDKAAPAISMRKVLSNMVYVGFLSELLNIDDTTVQSVVADQFYGKESVIDINNRVITIGREVATLKEAENFNYEHAPYNLKAIKLGEAVKRNQKPIFIDGNSAAALGALVGGCTVFAWYPITPATSLAESFSEFSEQVHGEQNKAAVLQSEDELSAITTVIGAGWAGSRAMTATSGPGLSLMSEAAGLSYFAEIPAVIWDVQRAGPSTGLPTRTSQGDIQSAFTLSHGDTQPVVLVPATPGECFEFAELAFDLAEELQTIVIVLSDLDLAMNYYTENEFQLPTREYRRGKVLSVTDLEKVEEFARYRDVDNDGITYRTLPGTQHPRAAYFTRGSGHTDNASYSENGEVYARLLDRLKKKIEQNQKLLPEPELHGTAHSADIGLVFFGSTTQIISELQDELSRHETKTCWLRIRALPLHPEIGAFLDQCKKVVVLEQNRDGQMFHLLRQKFPQYAQKMFSARQYDGLPAAAEIFLSQIIDLTPPDRTEVSR